VRYSGLEGRRRTADEISVAVIAVHHVMLFTVAELAMLTGALVGLLRLRARRAATNG
jgi:hypothetical protein